MKTSISLVIFSAVIFVTSASQAIIPPNPDHPGKCIYEGKELLKGKNQIPKFCADLMCHEDGTIVITGCGKFAYKNCVEGDLVNGCQPFPACCKRYFYCTDDNGVVHVEKFSPYD